jgi:hypothetical protein
MAKSYFAILEVSSSASPAEVRSAYRRLAKEYHPDYYEGDSKTFQQIQEAYAVLGDPDKRKAYENTLSSIRIQRTARQSPYPEPEPLVPRKGPVGLGEISPVRSFGGFSFSFDETFDWLWHNFSNASRNKSGRGKNLTMEVPLTREQALRGGNATLDGTGTIGLPRLPGIRQHRSLPMPPVLRGGRLFGRSAGIHFLSAWHHSESFRAYSPGTVWDKKPLSYSAVSSRKYRLRGNIIRQVRVPLPFNF